MKITKKLLLCLALSSSWASEIDDIKKSMMLNYIEQTKNIKIIQQENQKLVKQNNIYYTNVIKSAQRYYKNFIGKNWGEENVKLSNIKTFTQYSNDMSSRESIDFKNGTVTIEILTDPNTKIEPELFQKRLQTLKDEDLNQAILKDPVSKLSQNYLEKRQIITPTTKIENKKDKFLKEQIKKKSIKQSEIKETLVTLKNGKKKKIVEVSIKMVPDHLEKRAKKYKSEVFQKSKAFNVSPSHVFATIQAESYFNPLAISHIPAYGLMQIVPSSAGRDAYLALKGKNRLLSPYYLYNPKNNIEIGTKYIQIIQQRYLKGIKNRESLFYCSLTAYNAGIGTLIKSFTGSYKKRAEAIRIINSMTPQEVYTHLRTSKRLNKEAKNYVKRVTQYSKNYHQWDFKQAVVPKGS